MSLIGLKVVVLCRFGMGFLAFIFTHLVFRFTAYEGATHFLRKVFPVYQRLNAGLTIAAVGLLVTVVNNA